MDKTHQKLFDTYISFIADRKKRPNSIHSFMNELKLKEGTFYKYFSSFDQLEKDFWNLIFERTLKKIQSEEVYLSYSINEKLLAFYYSWIEELKDYREFVSHVMNEEKLYELFPSGLDLFKQNFEAFSTQLVEDGIATGEIANRLYITDKYKYALWYQPVTIIKFWVKDKSKDFEDTDALIEKTVNFSFDLMRSNGLDSFFDLAKFHLQHF